MTAACSRKSRARLPFGGVVSLRVTGRLVLSGCTRWTPAIGLEEKFEIRIPFDVYFQDPLESNGWMRRSRSDRLRECAVERQVCRRGDWRV